MPLEWLGVGRPAQRALKDAGFTQGEMHVFLTGPGKLKLSPNMPKVNKHLVEQVRYYSPRQTWSPNHVGCLRAHVNERNRTGKVGSRAQCLELPTALLSTCTSLFSRAEGPCSTEDRHILNPLSIITLTLTSAAFYQVRELPHSVYAVGSLEGMALMLQSLVCILTHTHPALPRARYSLLRVVLHLSK